LVVELVFVVVLVLTVLLVVLLDVELFGATTGVPFPLSVTEFQSAEAPKPVITPEPNFKTVGFVNTALAT
jgi:hypothetical protein